MNPPNVSIVFVTLVLAGSVAWGPAEGMGALHSVYGAVRYSGGEPPFGWPELQFHACILGKPDTLTPAPNAATTVWYDGQCWARVQCAEFSPPWQDGDLLHVFLWADGANNVPSFLPEACSVWIVLDATVPEQSMEGLWGLSLAPWIFWNLRAEMEGGELQLCWSPIPGEGMSVSVYRGTAAHFYPDVVGGANLVAVVPGSTGVYSDPYGVGDPEVNAFYRLTAFDWILWTAPGDVSDAVGEFDYSTSTSPP